MHQPILHNCKVAFSRLAGVVGQCLVPEDRLVFLEAISSVARRYAPPQLPRDSRALMRSVSQCFRSGISLEGCEAGIIASVVSSRMLLPLPFHSCLLSSSHIVLLLYAVDLPLNHSLWRALGVTHTFWRNTHQTTQPTRHPNVATSQSKQATNPPFNQPDSQPYRTIPHHTTPHHMTPHMFVCMCGSTYDLDRWTPLLLHWLRRALVYT